MGLGRSVISMPCKITSGCLHNIISVPIWRSYPDQVLGGLGGQDGDEGMREGSNVVRAGRGDSEHAGAAERNIIKM